MKIDSFHRALNIWFKIGKQQEDKNAMLTSRGDVNQKRKE